MVRKMIGQTLLNDILFLLKMNGCSLNMSGCAYSIVNYCYILKYETSIS